MKDVLKAPMTFHQEVSSDVKVGTRVACDGNCGTVKYIGSVSPFEGIWFGVEWDNPARGKHDGSYDKVRYFQTRHPTSGSFVRPHKVSLGQPITCAIIERYGAVEGDMAGVNKDNLESLKHEIKARFIEMVGFDKVNKQQSHFEDLKIVSVCKMMVNGAGPPGHLQRMCPNVRELDLSKNLLNTWESVAEIAVQLEFLENLTISDNILMVPHNPKALQDHFKSLKYIIAAKMSYDWFQILQCAIMWQKLELLKVPRNSISKLEAPPPGVFSNLRALDLSGNLIENWEEINKLGTISSLQQLNVSAVGISMIQFPGEKKTDLFPSLSLLNICDNNIDKWESISELNKLKSIEDLRIRNNPVLDLESLETTRQFIIARIANLKMLNGMKVCEERRGAEYDYLKKFALEWISLDGLPSAPDKDSQIQQFLCAHPRFPELITKHGLPELSELKKMPMTLAENVINIKFVSPQCPEKTYEKALFPTTEVMNLQGFAKRAFRAKKTPKLSYISCKMPGVEHPMPLFTRNLNFYAVEDGDTIIVRW
ncbi:tubulin-specific chaperone E isoform X2 [Bacillus rossius redtenbacheri]|uniref:tubulin-specific chaperone E isoform X2 n=1 Tax=Bacillus rossius redtenbacheri TaxID=93214 RepID=UPI002FDCE610